MDEQTYRDAVRRLRVGGWRYIEFEEIDAIEAAAEARHDLATLILVDVMMERDDTFARRFSSRIDEARLAELLDQLSDMGPFDELWHVLFGLVEREPSLLACVEEKIAHWPDKDRLVPRAWWRGMLAGECRDYFRLVRNSGLQGQAVDPAGMRRHAGCFQWLTELSLEGSALDIPTLQQFMALPEVRRLKRLSLARTGLRHDHAVALARGENLTGLKWLDVSSNDIGAIGAASLIGQGELANLEFLNLASCKMTFGAFASALSEVSPRRHPVRLNLTGTTLGAAGFAHDPAGFAAFVRSEAFRGVGGLELIFYAITPDEAEALAQSPTTTALRRFEINEGALGEAGVKAVLSSRWIRNAEHLNLFNQKTGDGIASHLSLLSGGAIEVLELLHNNLGPASGHALGSIDLRNLRQLSLSHNALGDKGAAAIFRNKTLTSLEHVNMQGVGAGPATARAIAENDCLRSLKTLWLGDEIGVAGARLLADAPHLASLAAAHLGGVPVSEQARLRSSPNLRKTRVTVYERSRRYR